MEISLLTPTTNVASTGNQGTAHQWKGMLEKSGHDVSIVNKLPESPPDLLIALHAEKSHEVALQFKRDHPDRKLILALTGTDIYPQPSETGLETMRAADALIALQSHAPRQLPSDLASRTHVIVQSAEQIVTGVKKVSDHFQVCVVGHLRDVKAPMLAAEASRLLPPDSKIVIVHAGGILESKYESIVERELAENPRYRRVGEVSAEEIATLEAESHLMVLSSLSEGGGRVVGEAIVQGTPVLSTRIVGIEGLLGKDYPGFYPVGDAEALARLLYRCETDPDFYAVLEKAAADLAPLFAPAREARLISELVDSIINS